MEVLPEEINSECLIRTPYQDFPTVRSVCRSWRAQIERPEFRRDRRITGRSQNVVVLAQVRIDRAVASPVFATPSHQLTVFEPESGDWRHLAPIPGFSGKLPLFCGLVAVGSGLVVIGGWDPDTYAPLSSVYVYSFLSGKWRRGADMPGGPRSFFGCSSDSDRTVYVAGGHDNDKNATRTAFCYDVEGDVWTPLPDMARERDECKGIFLRGRFHVAGGFGSETQGKYGRCAEAFDPDKWRWGPVDGEFLAADTCPGTCCAGADGAVYMCHKGEVVVRGRGSDEWEVAARLPDEARNVAFVVTWRDGLFLMGSTGAGEGHVGYLLDLKELTWTKLDTPEKCTGYVASGCCLQI